jgi:hypothetical protein
MKRALENICSEFSSEYSVTQDILGFLIVIHVDIEHLGDLTDIFQNYGVDLIEIRSITDYSKRCMAIFSKTEVSDL